MIRLAQVIDRFKADLLQRYTLSEEQQRALTATQFCRSSASPKMLAECTACDHRAVIPHSCGHRHCPHCQHHQSQQWLERQMQRLVPAEYFLITFTLPAEFRALAKAHSTIVFDLLMRCGWDTLQYLSQRDRQLGGTPGAIAVLHTHTRALDYHPHAHWVVPAATITECGSARQWRTKALGKRRYLYHHKALAKIFRAKFLAGLRALGLILPPRYPKDWVVDCKAVGRGEKALIYLGRYLYRGVIREDDILACEDGHVRFRYRNGKTGALQERSLPGAQFLMLILQHVLPRGFRRARNFGFLHPNRKRLLALLSVVLPFVPPHGAAIKPRPPIRCTCCGAAMAITSTRLHRSTTADVLATQSTANSAM